MQIIRLYTHIDITKVKFFVVVFLGINVACELPDFTLLVQAVFKLFTTTYLPTYLPDWNISTQAYKVTNMGHLTITSLVVLVLVLGSFVTEAREPSLQCLKEKKGVIENCLRNHLKSGNYVYYSRRLDVGQTLNQKELHDLRKDLGGQGWACVLEGATECING
ncbi:hypothetical protein Pcinc_002452 [Petrolisthes cinctipes]|uniref:Uncharacterized protein n=1 Tax=Petrolisthes cinctipes TaxID=88211 RepID=A0AAE1GLC4_PETCI|nr:hypothetical protein Pcinc_002452 [Petrolisthes cinctipes]